MISLRCFVRLMCVAGICSLYAATPSAAATVPEGFEDVLIAVDCCGPRR